MTTFYSICPTCGLKVVLLKRKDRESFTQHEIYEHMEAEHGPFPKVAGMNGAEVEEVPFIPVEWDE